MLAAELDGLDRRLSDLAWRQRTELLGQVSELSSERSGLEARRDRLTSTLRRLAVELDNLDTTLEHWKSHHPLPANRVGTCPDCGYPSLDSGLCAFCRPRLAL